jgi:hypothetical protein
MSDGLPRDLVDVITKAIRGHMSDVHVALPGRVLSYDNAANTADVEVQVKKAVWTDDQEREYEDAVVLPAVPVQWPRAGGFMLTMPLTKDDMVLLVFNDTAIGEWRTSGEVSEPWDARRHSIGYPVAIPGFFPDTSPPADASARAAGMVLGKGGAEPQIRISATEIKLGATASDFVALKTLVEAELNAIRTLFNGHTHSVAAAPGTSAVPVPVFSGSAGNVGATITKAK